MIWLHSHPLTPLSPLPSVSLTGDTQFVLMGGVHGGGAKSYDGEKAWSSINHSILSDDMIRSFSVQNKERGMILLENLLKREKPCFLINKREVWYNAADDLTRLFL